MGNLFIQKVVGICTELAEEAEQATIMTLKRHWTDRVRKGLEGYGQNANKLDKANIPTCSAGEDGPNGLFP